MVKGRIEGHVLDSEGKPIVGAIVTLPGVGKRTSRKDGRFVFDSPELREGRHSIRCDPPEGYQRPGDLSIEVEKGQNRITGLNFNCAPTAQPSRGKTLMVNQTPPNEDLSRCCEELKDTLKDIATFMPTRSETPGVAGGIGAEGVGAERRVSKVIAQVLGRPVGRDPRTFLAALTAAFPERGGQIVQEPVRGLLSLEVEAGQLAARQGSLFHEVQLIVKDALRILDGLRSIRRDTDVEKVDALREIVRSEFLSLLEEAGRVDLPRVSRVIEIMKQLFDERWGTLRAGLRLYPTAESNLGKLRSELGLDREAGTVKLHDDESIVTSEEAQQVVSMDLLDHYAYGVGGSFVGFFGEIWGQPSDTTSGRIEFVSLLLSVVAASVHEVEDAMDAVGLSAAKRRTVLINDAQVPVPVLDNAGDVVKWTLEYSTISVDGILSWTLTFAVEEGPSLIARSARTGFERVIEIAKALKLLVQNLLEKNLPDTLPHPGLIHPRVQIALAQLADELGQFGVGRSPSLPTESKGSISGEQGG